MGIRRLAIQVRERQRCGMGSQKCIIERMFNWDDLKYLLAIARHRSTIAAGKALHLSQSTVHRRLNDLERRIGRPLVTRHTTGYRLTAFGEELQPYAERVEAAVKALERHVADATRDEAGIIRLT